MDLEQKSIERIKIASEMSLHHYGKPLICTYSGGKDSDVMLELFKRSGVPFEVQNSHTTVDAPPTVQHICEVFRELEFSGIPCSIDYHRQPDGHFLTMWNLIPQKLMPPTRLARYCCQKLKEGAGANRMIATGVRWAESTKRRSRGGIDVIAKIPKDRLSADVEIMLNSDNDKKRLIIERCEMKAKIVCNPIIDWADRDIWEFYWNECKNHNPLYRMGYYRVGCIGCPMARRTLRIKGFHDFPTYERAYKRAFERMLENRKAKGLDSKWKNSEDVFHWWMEDPDIDGQLSMEFGEE
jgi:3'-phosphoadenosine 5'-phosphosulfate sulfotransferase (PAPS reductase)/FAD synthetase